ncbi:MAG: hypothetical protein N3A71_02450 [Candidatus Dojkabacteria bacterium]|nr:hypothetical protein [Candidatus Dojkabacteria bacterium]
MIKVPHRLGDHEIRVKFKRDIIKNFCGKENAWNCVCGTVIDEQDLRTDQYSIIHSLLQQHNIILPIVLVSFSSLVALHRWDVRCHRSAHFRRVRDAVRLRFNTDVSKNPVFLGDFYVSCLAILPSEWIYTLEFPEPPTLVGYEVSIIFDIYHRSRSTMPVLTA